MRMRHVRSRITAWPRRWAIWLAMVAGLMAMGAHTSWQQLAALPMALVLPLFMAAARGPAWLALATAGYAAAGALPLVLTRSAARCARWGWLPLQALLGLVRCCCWTSRWPAWMRRAWAWCKAGWRLPPRKPTRSGWSPATSRWARPKRLRSRSCWHDFAAVQDAP